MKKLLTKKLNYGKIPPIGAIKAGGVRKLGVIVMLNKFGKKICAGVCALSLGLNLNVKSDAFFWDVALIANEFLSGAVFTLDVSIKSAENLVKLIKYLATFEEEVHELMEEMEEDDDKEEEPKDDKEEEPKIVKVTWNQKLKKIKNKTPSILFGVLGPILLADAAKRSYELYKNLSESSSNQKKTSGNENIAGNKENKK